MFEPIIDAIKKSVSVEKIQLGELTYLSSTVCLPPPLQFQGLPAVSLEAIVAAVLGDETLGGCLISIESPTEVKLYNSPDAYGRRQCLVKAIAPQTDNKGLFNSFWGGEYFRIWLMTNFVQTDEMKALLAAIAGVQSESVRDEDDDGISQSVAVRSGVKVTRATLNPFQRLTPYRTFLDIEQPTSTFLFRMKDDAKEGVRFALHDAEGQLWQASAIARIKAYFEDNIPEDVRPLILG